MRALSGRQCCSILPALRNVVNMIPIGQSKCWTWEIRGGAAPRTTRHNCPPSPVFFDLAHLPGYATVTVAFAALARADVPAAKERFLEAARDVLSPGDIGNDLSVYGFVGRR